MITGSGSPSSQGSTLKKQGEQPHIPRGEGKGNVNFAKKKKLARLTTAVRIEGT